MIAEIINSPSNPVNTSVLRALGVSRTLAVTAASAEVVLTADCRVVSIKAVGCAMALRIGVGSQTAVATDHYLGDDERLDLAVAVGSTLAAIGVSGTGSLKISELV